MTDQVPNKQLPFSGGVVELAVACEFMGTNQQTGQPEEVKLKDRVVVTYGRKRSTLSGNQVKGLVHVYKESKEFRDWCEACG